MSWQQFVQQEKSLHEASTAEGCSTWGQRNRVFIWKTSGGARLSPHQGPEERWGDPGWRTEWCPKTLPAKVRVSNGLELLLHQRWNTTAGMWPWPTLQPTERQEKEMIAGWREEERHKEKWEDYITLIENILYSQSVSQSLMAFIFFKCLFFV